MLHSPLAASGLDPLACPICRGPLTPRPSGASCATCRLQYGLDAGVYLLGAPFVPARLPAGFAAARLRQLLSDASAVGFVEARRRFAEDVLSGRLRAAPAASRLARLRAKVAGATWEDVLQDLEDPARAGWKFLVELASDARVLFVGPSWGAVPLSLARSCARVIVLDGALDRLHLIRYAAASAGLANVIVARVSDPLALPVGDESIDLVVVPGLREWFGAVAPARAGRSGADLLRELRRTLAPGGQAYVGVDNRLGPARIVATGNGGPHYSPRALRDAALSAGFAACRAFAPLPFRHKFHQILDLDRPDAMNFSADGYRTRGRATRPLIRAWDSANRDGALERRLYPYVPGVTAVLAIEGGVPSSFAERLLQALAAEGRIPEGARTLTRYFVRPKGVAVLVAGTPDADGVIVRLPLEEQAALVCERHHRATEDLARDARIPAELRALFPAPIASGDYDGQRFFVERARPGESGRRYYSRSGRRYDRAITNAAEVVCALRRATETPVRIDALEFDRLCGTWLTDLQEIVPASTRDDLAAIENWLRATLIDTTLPLGWQHGDYDFANLLYGADDRVTAILDFEAFEPRGLPLIDLLLLLARRLIRRHGLSFGMLFVRAIMTRALPPLEAALFEREVQTVGADEQLCQAIALCCWLNHLRLRRDSWLVRSPSWLEDNLHAVVASVRRTL